MYPCASWIFCCYSKFPLSIIVIIREIDLHMSLFLTQVSPLLLILGHSDLDEVVRIAGGGALCATRRRPLSLAGGLILLVILHVKELEKTEYKSDSRTLVPGLQIHATSP